MPYVFSPEVGGWYYRDYKTLIRPVEDSVESCKSFQWPNWAINWVNEMILVNKVSYEEACKIVSGHLEKERGN